MRPARPTSRAGARPGQRSAAQTSRPARQRRTAGPPSRAVEVDARRSRRHGVTTRAAVLAVALCAVLLTLAVPFQQYVAQRGEISALAAKTDAQQRSVAELERMRARWKDPSYIRQQARARLQYVEPGETAYVVIPKKGTASHRAGIASAAASTVDASPWYAQLWDSVVESGATPAPATTQAPKRQPRVQREKRPAPIAPGTAPRG